MGEGKVYNFGSTLVLCLMPLHTGRHLFNVCHCHVKRSHPTVCIFNVYLFLREREGVRAGEGQRERKTEVQSRLGADSSGPDAGLELTNREITT